jgi:hypothetical protein
MKVNCPKCNKEFDITNIIPGNKNGVIVCDGCHNQFNVHKQLHEDKIVPIVFNREDKGPYPKHHPRPTKIPVKDRSKVIAIYNPPKKESKKESFFKKCWDIITFLPRRFRRLVCCILCGNT